jgi:hypothetical protein
MNLAASLKKAPRWAWYTAAGLGLGAAAITLHRNRGGGVAEEGIDNVPADDLGESVPVGSGSPSGVIVPPVIVGSSPDPNMGVGDLQGLYIGATQDLFTGWESLLGPLVSTQSQLLLGNTETLNQIAQAGSAPVSQPTPVVSAPAIPQQAPVKLPVKPVAATYRVVYENRTRDNGKSGKQRAVWCNRVMIHQYSDGRRIVVSEEKIRNGAC